MNASRRSRLTARAGRSLVPGLAVAAIIALTGCGGGGDAADEPPTISLGQRVYSAQCALCHGSGGYGQEPIYPSLIGSRYVADVKALTLITLQGSEYFEDEAYKAEWSGVMLPLLHLSDEEVAAVINHVHRKFGPATQSITPATVGSYRASLQGQP